MRAATGGGRDHHPGSGFNHLEKHGSELSGKLLFPKMMRQGTTAIWFRCQMNAIPCQGQEMNHGGLGLRKNRPGYTSPVKDRGDCLGGRLDGYRKTDSGLGPGNQTKERTQRSRDSRHPGQNPRWTPQPDDTDETGQEKEHAGSP